MAIQLRAANSATSSSNATSMTITLPTGSAAGDILFIVLRLGTNGLTVTQSAGTPTWTIQFQGTDATTHYTYAFATVVLTAGFSAPTFSWVTSTTWQYSVIGFSSTIGATLSVDAWNSAVVNTSTLSNTVTPNAVTAAGSGEASVILTESRANAASTQTDLQTFTPPTNWTTPSGGTAFQSANGAFNRFTGVCYQLSVSGTVTPGSESLTDTGSHTYTFVVAHVLAQEGGTAPAIARQRVTVPVPRLKPRAVIVVPPRPPAASPSPAIQPPVIPRPRPRGRAAVTAPRSLLASPPPVVPGSPVLLPLLLPRPRPRQGAVVVVPRLLPPSPPPAVVIPPTIPTSGGDRDVAVRVFRALAPGDVPAAGAQLPRLQGRAFLVPIPVDVEHAVHPWPEAPPGPSAAEQAIAAVGEVLGQATGAAGRLVEAGRIFADPPYERQPKRCGAIRKIGGVTLTCKRKPHSTGKHHDRGLDWSL